MQFIVGSAGMTSADLIGNHPSNFSQNRKIVDLKVALDERSGDHQSRYALHLDKKKCLKQIQLTYYISLELFHRGLPDQPTK